MERENYIVIQGWMRTELNLKGNDLLVYAIIYGFSQSNQGKFNGSRQYLADWCGCSIRSIQTILNNLVNLSYIIKTEYYDNNIKHCDYTTNFTSGEKISLGSENISLGGEKIALYNTNYTNTTDISSNTIHNISSNTSILGVQCEKNHKDSDFLGSVKEKPKENMYQKCIALISDLKPNKSDFENLVYFLNMLLDNARESGKPLYTNNFKGKLNNLKKYPKNDWGDIIKQSIDRGWSDFYELKDRKSFDGLSHNQSFYEDEEYVKEHEEWIKEMEADGKQVKF